MKMKTSKKQKQKLQRTRKLKINIEQNEGNIGKDLFFAIAAVANVDVAVIAATHDWFSIRSCQ